MNSGSLSGAILTDLSSEDTAFIERHIPMEELKAGGKGAAHSHQRHPSECPQRALPEACWSTLGKPSYGIRCLPNQESAQGHVEPEDYRETQS